MAHGFSLTRHDGLPAYAERLASAGAAVLVFDYRHLGDSPGQPRQRFRKAAQLEDWRAAVAAARALPQVDPARIVLWGFSFGGGHAVETAAADGDIAATIVLCPFLDGLARVLATPPRVAAWLLTRAVADVAGRHNLVPVTGPVGGRAAMPLPGEADGFAAVVPPGSPWAQRDQPRPVRHHRLPSSGGQGPQGEMPPVGRARADRHHRVAEGRGAAGRPGPGGGAAPLSLQPFEPFLGDGPGRVTADQVDFLRRTGILTD